MLPLLSSPTRLLGHYWNIGNCLHLPFEISHYRCKSMTLERYKITSTPFPSPPLCICAFSNGKSVTKRSLGPFFLFLFLYLHVPTWCLAISLSIKCSLSPYIGSRGKKVPCTHRGTTEEALRKGMRRLFCSPLCPRSRKFSYVMPICFKNRAHVLSSFLLWEH